MTPVTIYTPSDEEVRHGLPLGRRLRECQQGYVAAARLDNYVDGRYLAFMKKAL